MITGNFISVDSDKSEMHAVQVERTTDALNRVSLYPKDDVTTLPANTNLHIAFSDAQLLIDQLGRAMDEEAKNIRSIGVTFEQYDAMLGDLADVTFLQEKG